MNKQFSRQHVNIVEKYVIIYTNLGENVSILDILLLVFLKCLHYVIYTLIQTLKGRKCMMRRCHVRIGL